MTVAERVAALLEERPDARVLAVVHEPGSRDRLTDHFSWVENFRAITYGGTALYGHAYDEVVCEGNPPADQADWVKRVLATRVAPEGQISRVYYVPPTGR